VLCEDTRVTARLLDRYGIRVPLRAYTEHNAASAGPAIIKALQEGAAYALVSDAGMPLVSDPGERLVAACHQAGVAVAVVPGASAVLAALALSGFPPDPFVFLGFLPHKSKARHDALLAWKSSPATLVAFESPHRVVETLAEIENIFPNRIIGLARELTKLHEEMLIGKAGEIRQKLEKRDSVKGEIVLLIHPSTEQTAPYTDEDLETAIKTALLELPASKAAAQVAKMFHQSKDEIYARILKLKGESR
jgi:16S rRNA (cytidine1402-2'-O)-methyltransferase